MTRSLLYHGKQPVDTIYIDFSRAFDSVVHSKLIHKLRCFGINGLLLKWIEAFLYCRSQFPILLPIASSSYTDDLKLYSSLTSLDDCHNLQVVLSNLLIWSNNWQLKVNVSECHILHLHKNSPLMDYYFNHIRLEPCYLVNDIGVDIDSLLNFDKHILTVLLPKIILVEDYWGFVSRNVHVFRRAYIYVF